MQVGEADGDGNLVKKKSVITLMQHVSKHDQISRLKNENCVLIVSLTF